MGTHTLNVITEVVYLNFTEYVSWAIDRVIKKRELVYDYKFEEKLSILELETIIADTCEDLTWMKFLKLLSVIISSVQPFDKPEANRLLYKYSTFWIKKRGWDEFLRLYDRSGRFLKYRKKIYFRLRKVFNRN